MAVNKVVYGTTVLVDLTEDTVTAETLAEGVTAHNAAGELIVGTLTEQIPDMSWTFTDSTIWTCPFDGLYTIFAVGAGGAGATPALNTSYYHSAGGAGGAGYVIAELTKGAMYNVTIASGNASFGSLISATCGTDGTTSSSSKTNTGGKAGSVSGTNVVEITSSAGGCATSTAFTAVARGGSISAVTIDDVSCNSSGGAGGAYNNRIYSGSGGAGLFGSNGAAGTVTNTYRFSGGGGGSYGGGGGAGGRYSTSYCGAGGAGGGACVHIITRGDHVISPSAAEAQTLALNNAMTAGVNSI